MNSAKDKLAERLKLIRSEQGLSQQQMAEALGVSRMAYRYYESAQRTPDVDFLDRLHDYTELPIEYLLGRTESQSYDTIYSDKELGLSGESIEKLKENGAHRDIVDLLLKNGLFSEWANWVNDYLMQLGYLRIAGNAKKTLHHDASLEHVAQYEQYIREMKGNSAAQITSLLNHMLDDENTFLPYAKKVTQGGYAEEPLTMSFMETVQRWMPTSYLRFSYFLTKALEMEGGTENANKEK